MWSHSSKFGLDKRKRRRRRCKLIKVVIPTHYRHKYALLTVKAIIKDKIASSKAIM
jgi:hypothetical protein